MLLILKKILTILRKISPGACAWALSLNSFAQCPSHQQFWDKLKAVETSSESQEKKLDQVIKLKKEYEKCGIEKDSVYARMLHKIGLFEYYATGEINDAIKNTIEAIKINTSGKKGACLSYSANSYSNLGFYYRDLSRYTEALIYFDSAISVSMHFPAVKNFAAGGRRERANIYYKKGDYEKAIEEATLGLQVAEEINDTSMLIANLLERSQAYEIPQNLTDAWNDANKALFLLQNWSSTNNDLWANAYRYKADVLADQHHCKEALDLYKTAILFRTKNGNISNIATDYNDAGYMLMYKCNNPSEAKKYFNIAYQMSIDANDNGVGALAVDNLAQASFNAADYKNALQQYQHSLQLLTPHYKLTDVTKNPPYKELNSVEKKSFLEVVLDNKSKSFLYLYKQTHDVQFLKSSIATALLVDSIITDLRHEQSGEQSKLYWRNDTRDFFTRTIEACFLDNNPGLAFFFMEKSRAVLLNDKLNELGASARLPAAEAAKEESLQINITVQQQQLALLNDTSKEYAAQQNKLLLAKEDFEHYIKTLEKNYPAYYQYKYADEVPSLSSLQKYLASSNQSFVHYFMGDTVTYILAITSGSTKFIRLSQKDFNREQLVNFLRLCSEKENLNSHYSSFAALSNSIYKVLFQDLQITKGRVIICADNFLIPFEALCDDASGKHFLLYDYSFSYVYSARYLMKQFSNPTASGNFLGFAPVSFASYLGVPDLKNAADALHTSSAYYNNDKLFTNQNATRSNFFHYASSYSIVSIFSHARADTTDNEPELFMQDSVIRLSELQLLNNPAARLVLLSACQTNIGKNATGEGVYSLARGFTSAGIPSVAATLWKADEQTIYAISEKFNEYLSKGMNKDEALQKAKLYFIQNNSNEKMLPYYWANMILIGNADAIKLETNKNYTYAWIISGAVVLLLILTVFFFRKKPRNKLTQL